MKIQESVSVVNSDRTIAGHKDLQLTFDTETGELKVDVPAMFTDPVVYLDELQKAIDNLAVHKEKTDAQDQGR